MADRKVQFRVPCRQLWAGMPLRTIVSLLIVLALPSSTPAFAAPSTSGVPFGVNLEGLADWMRTPMFVDAFKTSRRFGSPDKPWDGDCKLGPHGWPTGDFGVIIFADAPGIGGTYQLVFDGTADITVPGSTADVKNAHFDGHRTTANIIVPATATQLFLSFRNTKGVTNVRLLRPGYPVDTHQIFTDEFRKAIKPYSTLRLMDYLATNGNPIVHWSDRPTEGDAHYTDGSGGPYEPMIALANASGKDLWVNVPDQADDDYVKHMATLFKTQLAPGRHVYLEYSNEVWNWSFVQANRNKEVAKLEAKDPKSPLNISVSPDDDPHNETYWAFKRIPERLQQIRKIWQDVYGQSTFDATVRPVLASQIGWPFVIEEQLAFIDRIYGPPSRFLYAIAGAPYYNMGGLESKADITKDEVLAALGKSVDDYAGHGLDVYPLLAAKYHVKLVAYEGGVDIGQGDQGLDAKLASQSDPRMRTITRRYLDAWYGHSGGLFMYFTLCSGWGKWGAWGLTDDLTKSTPKTEGVADVLAATPPPVDAGIAVPSTITGSNFALMRWGTYKAPATGGDVGHLGKDDIREYLVNVQQAGMYRIAIHGAASADVAIDVTLDGVPVKTSPTTTKISATLDKVDRGLHALHIGIKNGSIDVKDIVWSR